MKATHRAIASAALAVAILAALVFGWRLAGYAHALHPLALLGATGMPRATAFNVLGFVLPGALAAWLAMALRSALPANAGGSARIGAGLLLVSALAFAAQGLLPLDPEDLDGSATQCHASAWLAWWIGFVSGAAVLAVGLRGIRTLRRLALASAVAAGAVLLFAAAPWPDGIAPVVQRLATLAWLGWLPACGAAIDRLRHPAT